MTTPEQAYEMVMAAKPTCAHKNKFLKCRDCLGDFCARCIQLEVHFCPKLNERSKIEKDNLSKKLVKVVAPKVITF
jgi:predicted nucleic acid binding AN1-type Zn finger protein